LNEVFLNLTLTIWLDVGAIAGTPATRKRCYQMGDKARRKDRDTLTRIWFYLSSILIVHDFLLRSRAVD
jgi:hypothetical protein